MTPQSRVNSTPEQVTIMAREVFKSWVTSAEGLGSLSEDYRRDLFFRTAELAFEAAEEFSNVSFGR